MGKEYTRDASEHGQNLIVEAIRSLGSIDNSEISGIQEDIAELQSAVEALQEQGSGGGSSTPTSENNIDLSIIHIGIEQTENQTIQCTPFLVGASVNGVPTLQFGSSDGFSDSIDIQLGLLCQIVITPSEGYTAGELVLPEGISSVSNGGQSNYIVVFPIGSDITISANPATPIASEP